MTKINIRSDLHIFFSLHRLPAFTRFILFTLSACPLSNSIAVFSLIFSEIQIFTVLINTLFFTVPANNLQWLKIFKYIHQLSSVGDLIDYENSPFINFTTIIVMCVYIFLFVSLAMHIFICLLKKETPGRFEGGLWRVYCNIHSNVMFYPIHFTLLKMFSELHDGETFNTSQSTRIALQVFAGIALGLNLMFSLMILRYFQASIKIHNPLSTKTNLPALLNLVIKIMYPFIFLFYPKQSGVVVFVSINLGFSIIRDAVHFHLLPYYKYSILELATGMHATSTLFAITGFISTIIDLIDGSKNTILSIILWLLFLPLLVKAYLTCLQRLAIKILLRPNMIKNPYHLVHQWYIFKHFARYANKPNEISMEHKRKYLIYETRIKQTQISEDSVEDQNLAKTLVLSSIIDNLKIVLDQNPKSDLLKTHLAAHYIKTNQLNITTDKYIYEKLCSSKFSSGKNSLYLMRLKIIKKLRKMDSLQSSGQLGFMDAQECITNNENLEILKVKIRGHIKLQLSFWEKFKSHTVQLYSLITLSKQTQMGTDAVQSFWNNLQSLMKLENPDHLLVFGVYACLVREDENTGRNLLMKYSNTKLKEKNEDIEINSIGQKRMTKTSVWLAISGQPKELGKVLRCSNEIGKSLGVTKNAIIGESINVLIPSFFRTKHNSYFQLNVESESVNIMQRTREINILNSEGYLVSCYIYMLLSFLPGVGLGYFAALEPTQKDRRVAYCREDGTVIECSRNFAEDMNIDAFHKQKDFNIYDFSLELRRIETEFMKTKKYNRINRPKRTIIGDLRDSSIIKKSSEKSVITKQDQGDLNYGCENILNGQKLLFSRLSKENGMAVSDRSPIKDTPDEIVYNVALKVYAYEYGNMIEVIMDTLDSGDMEILQPVTKSKARTGILKNKDADRKISSAETEFTEKDTRKVSVGQSVNKTSVFRNTTKKRGLTLNENLFENLEETQYTKQSLFSPGREDRPLLLLSDNALESPGNRGAFVTQTSEIQTKNIQKLIPQVGDDSDVTDPEVEYTGPENKGTMNAEFDQVLEEYGSKSIPLEKEVISHKTMAENAGPNKQANNSLQSVSSITASSNERKKKVLKAFLRSKKLGRFSVGYIIMFGLTMLIAMAFMLWFSLNAPSLSKNIKSVSTVLQTLQLRNFATNLCNQESRLGASMNTIAHDLSLFPRTLVGVIGSNGTIPNSFKILKKYATQLENAVALADGDVQDLFYEKNVRVYDRDDDNNLVFLANSNTFQVLDDILSNGFLVASYPYPPSALTELPKGFRFLFDNSVNDLLVVTENISDVLFRRIENMYYNAQKSNIAGLSISLAVLIAFIGGSFHFIMKINNQFLRFSNVLLTVPTSDIDKVSGQLAGFDSLLAKESNENEYLSILHETYVGINPRKEREVSNLACVDNRKAKGNVRQAHSESIKQVYRANYILFVQLLLALLLVAICFIVFYVESQNSIETLHTKQIHMNTALLNINQQSLISVQLQGMILDNDTTTLRNEPIEASLKISIDRLHGVSELQKSLEESNGVLSEAQTNLFYHYDCSKLSTTLFDHLNPVALNRKCLEITNGQIQVALSTLLPKMASELEDLNLEFQTSNRTEDFLRYIYIKALSLFLSPIDVSVAMFAISYDATAASVAADLAQLHKANFVMAGMAVVVSLVVSSLIWWLVVKRMTTKQFEIKQILALVPTKVILESPHLLRYLTQSSIKDVPELKIISKL